MKTTLFAFILIILTACSNDRTIVINDLSKPIEQPVITTQENPANYSFTLKGEADGTYRVNNMDFEKGVVDTSFSGDWYADTLVFKYQPGTAKNGHLTIRYRF